MPKQFYSFFVALLCAFTAKAEVTYHFDEQSQVLRVSGEGAADDGGYRSYVRSVILEEGITSVKNGGFNAAYNLQNISFPSTLQSIGNLAFNCADLRGSVTVPSSVQSIGDSAFRDNHNLQEVIISDGVKSIGAKVFYATYNLTSISIPDSLETIHESSFISVAPQKIQISSSMIEKFLNAMGSLQNVTDFKCTDSIAKCKKVLRQLGYENLIEYVSFGGVRVKKRFYTIQEAEALSKKSGNKFKLRYK